MCSVLAQVPLFIFPFLGTVSRTKPFEFLRLTSLGLIGALVKNEQPETIAYLLGTDIVPHCLRIMELGNDLCKTVAIFVIQKILLDQHGLAYICQTDQRLSAILDHLDSAVRYCPAPDAIATATAAKGGSRLLKHAIRCYLRLTEEERGLRVLRQRMPAELANDSLADRIRDDPSSVKFLQEIRARVK